VNDSDTLGVVLAGGASRRLGRDKAALAWSGTTLAERAAAVLAQVCGEVVVAGSATLARDGLESIADLYPGCGPLAGLHAGMVRAAGRPVFALACDLPFVNAGLVRHLMTSAGGRAEGAWVAADDSGVQPLCGVYAPAGRAVAELRLRRGELSVHGFLGAVAGVAVPVGPELEFYRPGLLLNLNRPEDLRRARRLRTAGGAPR
jgi:molybdopterin-guanine dinucleotide biosynthesis protein A